MEVPVEGQSRERTLHMQAEATGSAVAGEGGGGVWPPCQQGAHQVAQAVQEGGHVDCQPLVQLLGKGKVRVTAMPRGAQHWEKISRNFSTKGAKLLLHVPALQKAIPGPWLPAPRQDIPHWFCQASRAGKAPPPHQPRRVQVVGRVQWSPLVHLPHMPLRLSQAGRELPQLR